MYIDGLVWLLISEDIHTILFKVEKWGFVMIWLIIVTGSLL